MPITERTPGISPDGRLLAYTSRDSEDYELHLTSFPSGQGRWTVSLNGAARSFWGKDPDHPVLYYYSRDGWTLFRVSVKWNDQRVAPDIGPPQQLLEVAKRGVLRLSHTDPSRDGKRLLSAQWADFKQDETNEQQGEVVWVQNWFSEFKSKYSND